MRRTGKAPTIAWIGLSLALAACGGRKDEASSVAAVADPTAAPVAAPAPATPAAPGAGAPAAATPTAPSDAAPAPPPASAAMAPTGTLAEAPAAAADAGPSPSGLIYPARNTVIRDPKPGTPEHLIAQALAAALNPDPEAGWRQFEALLHTSEKEPNALISRRELNWPAMRRKVALFLAEDPTKPIYKWAYAEEPGGGQLKIFVHNPKSMPTPCYVKRDSEQGDAWKIQTCSL